MRTKSNNSMNAIIDNIVRAMKEAGLSQKELALKSGLTIETVNRVLRGKTPLTPNTLQKLSDGLGLSVADIEETRVTSLNYAVQGYLQLGDEITHITSFKQLQRVVDKYQALVIELPQQAKNIIIEEKKNAIKVSKTKNTIDANSIDFYKEEEIDASAVETWSFRKTDDVRDGVKIDIGNMCISYHFDLMGRTFTNSEALYICGLFSQDTEQHQAIQQKLISAKSGYDAKKSIRTKYEDTFGRKDWESFNVEWMKFCVWQKIKGNEAFRKVLMSIPLNAYIIENSTHQSGQTATFWGMKNKELEQKRDILADYTKYKHREMKKKDLDIKLMEARNMLNHIGTWKGVNCMGKILKYLQLCLINEVEPKINYDLLRSKQMYLFGELLTFTIEE